MLSYLIQLMRILVIIVYRNNLIPRDYTLATLLARLRAAKGDDIVRTCRATARVRQKCSHRVRLTDFASPLIKGRQDPEHVTTCLKSNGGA